MSIDKLQALLEAATPGPWGAGPGGHIRTRHIDDVTEGWRNKQLIVALVNAAPELLAVVRAVHDTNVMAVPQAINDALEALDAKLGVLGD